MPTSSDGGSANLTILTQPPPLTAEYGRELLRRLRYRRGPQRRGGPPSVAASLFLGLRRAGVAFRADPPPSAIGGDVGVLSHVDTLGYAIRLKRGGKARWLVAGPNLVVAPDRNHGVLAAPEVDRVVVASSWVRDMFLSRAPGLRDRIVVWPSGVDEEVWSPASVDSELIADVLVYAKSGPPELLVESCAALDRAGLRYTILRYGGYRPVEYLALLHGHRWMLFLSESETQGLALFEAWACNVPTLVWDRGRCLFEDIDWPGASSAPYLATSNGRSFPEPTRLDEAIADMERSSFEPRRTILERFTARQTALEYARLFPAFVSGSQT